MRRPRLLLACLITALLLIAALTTAVLGDAGGPAAAATNKTVVFTYVVRGLGNTSSLATFADDAAETYADSRGWGLGGSVVFTRVASGGDFTLWLSAAANLPGFGSPCDSEYSCTAGRNVIINETRWLHASPSWNAAHGSLRNYRHMVVNHETGHWLGFGHAFCGGPGQPAPVMQQQSISLQGCRFNPWPLASERQRLADRLGVAIGTGQPIGALELARADLGRIRVAGWALDPDTSAAVTVHVLLDGGQHSVVASRSRPDIAKAHPGKGSAHGYALTLAARPGSHRICVVALNKAGGGTSAALGCRTVTVSAQPTGKLDPVRTASGTVTATGWAIDPDTTAPILVHLYVDSRVGTFPADVVRPSVGRAYPHYGSRHGFSATKSAPPGSHRVCVYALNAAGRGQTRMLGCQTVIVPGK